jgi:transposase
MGVLDRLVLRDEQWERISPHIIGDERLRGSSGRDNRMFLEAVLWIVRTGSPWRDLPEMFGEWNSAHLEITSKALEPPLNKLFVMLNDRRFQ